MRIARRASGRRVNEHTLLKMLVELLPLYSFCLYKECRFSKVVCASLLVTNHYKSTNFLLNNAVSDAPISAVIEHSLHQHLSFLSFKMLIMYDMFYMCVFVFFLSNCRFTSYFFTLFIRHSFCQWNKQAKDIRANYLPLLIACKQSMLDGSANDGVSKKRWNFVQEKVDVPFDEYLIYLST